MLPKREQPKELPLFKNFQNFAFLHATVDPQEQKTASPVPSELQSVPCTTTYFYKWVIGEFEKIFNLYKPRHAARLFVQNKHFSEADSTRKALEEEMQKEYPVIQKLEKTLIILNNNFCGLLRKHSNDKPDAPITDARYRSYNNHIHADSRKKKSSYPKMFSYFILSIYQEGAEASLPSEVKELIKKTITANILLMSKKDKPYGAETFVDYMNRALSIELNLEKFSNASI